jgi:hypothetical protein
MTRSLRRAHLRAWLVAAPLAAAILLLGILSRPGSPGEEPAAMEAGP